MGRVARVFDLDSFDRERPTWIAFLESIAPPEFWQPFFAKEGYFDAAMRLREVGVALDAGFGCDLYQLRGYGSAFFRRTYTHVDMYHGTRVLDEDSYRTRGVRRSCIAELNEIASRLLGDPDAVVRAASNLQASGYSAHNAGCVGVWFSRMALLEYGSYCARGSEYLNLLSREIGPEAHKRMISAGRPAVIRCRFPIAEVEAYCPGLAALAVKRLFQIVDPDVPLRVYLDDDAPMLSRDIPPEWIEIEYLTEGAGQAL